MILFKTFLAQFFFSSPIASAFLIGVAVAFSSRLQRSAAALTGVVVLHVNYLRQIFSPQKSRGNLKHFKQQFALIRDFLTSYAAPHLEVSGWDWIVASDWLPR